MRKFRVHGLRFVAFGIVAFGAFGLIVSGLWNALMPAIFGLQAINFWQAIGLLILSRILFGGWHGAGRRRGHGKCVSRWDHLNPEEKERFRQAMHERCADGPEATVHSHNTKM
jgi:hypothetical protein